MPKRRIRHAAIVQGFGEQLRQVRLARGLTQKGLADKAHVTLSYVSKLEAGGAAPGLDLLERLATALNVSIPDLLPSPKKVDLDDRRKAVRDRFETMVTRAGEETLAFLELLFVRMGDSPATGR